MGRAKLAKYLSIPGQPGIILLIKLTPKGVVFSFFSFLRVHEHISAVFTWVPNIPAPLNEYICYVFAQKVPSAQKRHACVCE